MNTNRTFENGFPRSRKGLQKGRKSKVRFLEVNTINFSKTVPIIVRTNLTKYDGMVALPIHQYHLWNSV